MSRELRILLHTTWLLIVKALTFLVTAYPNTLLVAGLSSMLAAPIETFLTSKPVRTTLQRCASIKVANEKAVRCRDQEAASYIRRFTWALVFFEGLFEGAACLATVPLDQSLGDLHSLVWVIGCLPTVAHAAQWYCYAQLLAATRKLLVNRWISRPKARVCKSDLNHSPCGDVCSASFQKISQATLNQCLGSLIVWAEPSPPPPHNTRRHGRN
jgi:hypothetical protein